MLNLVSLLQKNSALALITKRSETSFDQLHERVERTAAGFRALGVLPGHRILLLMPMSIDLYVSLLALFWIDATVMLVDPSAPLDQIFNRFKPQGFIGSPKAHLLRLKHAGLRGLPVYVSTGFIPLIHKRLEKIVAEPVPVTEPKHPALLTFTTGTTGTPKAMARSHAFLLAQHNALSGHMDFKPGDVDLPTLPVFLLHSLAAGATCVIPDADLRNPGAVDPKPVVDQIESNLVTSMSGAPAFFNAICKHVLENGGHFQGVKKIFTGGGRVLAADVERIQTCFPNATITIVYGSTEAEPIATLNASKNLDRLRDGEKNGRGALVGRPVDEIEVKVVNDEVWVSGQHVNRSYFQSPERDNENKVSDGERVWHKTGDAGYLQDSEIWLLGRIGDAVDGHWPMPVEGAVRQLPFVLQAALVGHEDQAVLVLVLDSQPENWRQQVATITARPVIITERIPLDPRHNTKIDRKRLLSTLIKNDQDLI